MHVKTEDESQAYWAQPEALLLARLRSSKSGLSAQEAASRLQSSGLNTLQRESRLRAFEVLLRQFRSPLVLELTTA